MRMMHSTWQRYPPIEAPPAVLALATDLRGLWAGGAGGLARYHHEMDEWRWIVGGSPFSTITALALAGRWVFAGSAEGLVRSPDGGASWQVADDDALGAAHPVTAIVPSPRFSDDGVVLAATLGGGVLRSENAGRTWRPANFGLQNFEVNGLAWHAQREDVLAATSDGVYHSPNGGRAWRSTEGTEGLAVAAVAFLNGNRALAAREKGGLLQSNNCGASWSPLASNLTAEMTAATLFAALDAIWLGASEGAFRSADGGYTWELVLAEPVLSFAGDGTIIYAGTADGLYRCSTDGAAALPAPPVHDLRYLLIADRTPCVAGLHAGLWRWDEAQREWKHRVHAPAPLTAVEVSPDGALVAAGAEGLLRSTDGGESWRQCLSVQDGTIARITFGSAGLGWAASSDGAQLWRTRDGGHTWQALDPPFGALPLAALQAMPHGLIAATYDRRLQLAQLWLSTDDGATWRRGAEAKTNWPVVAACAEPLVITLGDQAFVHEFGGHWGQYPVGADRAGVRRIAAWGQSLFALTASRLLRSADGGLNWLPEADVPMANEILDMAVADGVLYLLLSGGRVWSRPARGD